MTGSPGAAELLEKQAVDQLPDGKYWDPFDEVKVNASTVPTINVVREREFAVLDIKVLQDWSAQSPDMNIIEHVWGRMKEETWKMKPKNLDELWEACKTAFFAIPDDFINKLYESLPNRMDAVLQAHGSHSRY